MEMNAGTNSKERYQKYITNEKLVRECAGKLLEHWDAGNDEPLKGYPPRVIQMAGRLLVFEGLASVRPGLTINKRGKEHVKKYGFVVYPT